MDDSKTFGGSTEIPQHPLVSKQKEDVARMKTSLLSCTDDPQQAVKAVQQVTVLRVFHQITRIVRYLELMDKLEAKLYSAIDHVIDTQPEQSVATMMMLMNVQERLQSNMIESHKILQPYIKLEDTLAIMTPGTAGDDPKLAYREQILSKESRDKLRSASQSILEELQRQSDVCLPEPGHAGEEVTTS